MKTKLLVPILACALLASIDMNAQAPAPQQKQEPAAPQREFDPHQRAEQSANKAEKRYGLDPGQKNQWQTAAMQRNMERQQIRMQMRGETTPEQRKELRAMAKRQNEQFDATVKGILTPEQLTKYNKDKAEREKKHKAKMKAKKQDDKEIPELAED